MTGSMSPASPASRLWRVSSTLRSFCPKKRVSTKVLPERAPDVNEILLSRLLHSEGTSAAGTALQLTWQAGLTLEEITALTWDQVDVQRRLLEPIPGKTVPMNDGLAQFLERLRMESGRAGEPSSARHAPVCPCVRTAFPA